MAYVKTTWQTGDVITAEKLNNMEGGIEAAAPLYVDIESEDGTTFTASETMATIGAALQAGRIVILRDMYDFSGSCIAHGDNVAAYGTIISATQAGGNKSIKATTISILSVPGEDDTVVYFAATVAAN